MRLITILNRCTKFKRFVFEGSHLDEHERIMVNVRSRKNSKAECSRRGQLSTTYDTTTDPRLFEFVPLWGFPVFLVYRMRRVDCKACGRVVVEKVPWSTGKHHLTDIYRCFLAQWAKKLSWTEVARSFRTSWEKVYHPRLNRFYLQRYLESLPHGYRQATPRGRAHSRPLSHHAAL
jgi:transposase